MAGFLAAVTQAPLTAFIIVMEMVDGHSMVLSLMASLISRMISRPLHETLAEHMHRAVITNTPAPMPSASPTEVADLDPAASNPDDTKPLPPP